MRIPQALQRWLPGNRLTPDDRAVIGSIRARRLTYLSDARLECIARTCNQAIARGLPGRFVEAGCALGGSAILMACLKETQRPLHVHDVFGMIPAPGAADGQDVLERYELIRRGEARGISGDAYYGYEQDLLKVVRGHFEAFGVDLERERVSLIQGLVQDTLTSDEPVAFAHIDVDWYDPVMTCLERLIPRLVVGGSIIIDDYHDWTGCRRATDTYFERSGRHFAFDDTSGSLRVTRTS